MLNWGFVLIVHPDKIYAFIAHVVHETVVVFKSPVILLGVHRCHRVHRLRAGVGIVRVQDVQVLAQILLRLVEILVEVLIKVH